MCRFDHLFFLNLVSLCIWSTISWRRVLYVCVTYTPDLTTVNCFGRARSATLRRHTLCGSDGKWIQHNYVFSSVGEGNSFLCSLCAGVFLCSKVPSHILRRIPSCSHGLNQLHKGQLGFWGVLFLFCFCKANRIFMFLSRVGALKEAKASTAATTGLGFLKLEPLSFLFHEPSYIYKRVPEAASMISG